MAKFISGGLDVFRARAYGEHHPNSLQYLKESVERGVSNWTGHAARYAQMALDKYESVANSSMARLTKAVRRQAGGLLKPNRIRRLNSIDDLQAPPSVMIPYLMLQKDIRKLHVRKACAGYGSDYIDMHPHLHGEDNPLYRNVMNGIVVDTDDGWEATTYYPDIIDDTELDLDITEQADIINSWEAMAIAILNKDDPTSRFNAELS